MCHVSDYCCGQAAFNPEGIDSGDEDFSSGRSNHRGKKHVAARRAVVASSDDEEHVVCSQAKARSSQSKQVLRREVGESNKEEGRRHRYDACSMNQLCRVCNSVREKGEWLREKCDHYWQELLREEEASPAAASQSSRSGRVKRTAHSR